ncbi:EntF, Non-ribosomal peptide synthetase module protein [Pyrenophora tritici-repentis]|uniref:EntF, Non-ribosomal peptide synthetase module protein n=1 Tax=Pyrenophora tritici-repentis TaxID=45151 RepID=A0A834RZ66_9PLEO|nr:EntF, Non-ribosomal peptide synthetase module protein [Pyrenophora tritici-repentis]
MLPIQVPSHTRGDLLEVIRHTKDGMRKFPDNGRSYFASRFADADTSDVFASMFPVEVIFNYQGVYQQLERTDSLFKTLPAPDGCEPASMLEARAKRQQQVANWIERYEMALVEMATLLQKKHKQWTLSDLPLAFKTYEDLDSFQNDTLAELGVQPEEVEDVFPCLPMQEGILISQSRDPDAYRVSSIFEVIPTQQNQVNCTRLQQAWEAVVRRHSLLRALLVDNVPGSLGTTNVVLKDPQPSISFFRAAGDTATLAMFRAHQDTLAQQDSGLQHRMFICQLDNGKAYLCLDINHAIFDAHSRGVILRDLQSAYSANLNPDSGRFRDVVSYLTQQEQEETHAYWARYLDGVEPCFFSSMAEPQDVCYRDGTVHVPDIDANAVHTFCQTWDITIATIIQTAWALVLSRYTGATTPCFGNLSSRRDLPVEDVANIFGPLITTIACRVQLDEHKTVMDVLRAVQSDYTNSLPHQNISLASVHSMLGLGANALFNTILSLQRIDDTMAVNDSEIDFRGQSGSDPTEYAINIGAGYNRSVMEIEIHYQTRCIDDAQAANLAESLSQAIYGIITKTTSTIGDLQILSKRQQQQLWKWNGEVPPVVERCVHELFVEQARARPDAAAICAWDGEMKYGELDELSSRLAGYLVGLGVGPEAIVPLCFEKSMWTVVAMLAVLKAGGAFAPLDPEHPASRHEEIFRQTGARVVLASAQHSTLCSGGNRTVVVVSEAAMRELPSEASEASTTDKRTTTRTKAQPDNPAYVLFTSGSTGKPKGVVIEHRAILTSCLGHGKAFNLTSDSRFLQFSSYTFDVSITEIWTTLLVGGCTCVPSESDKKDDLSKAINALDANWAYLTPLLRSFSIQSASRDYKILSSEQNLWSPYARQITAYGPTECCVLCTFYSGTLGFYTGLLGKSVASVSWVVDPNDHHKLAPLGAVGELLVEGPILARGYLNDAEKTAAAFIDDPAWLLEGCDQHAGRRGRLYKTGDLVYYNADGNLVYVNRKDAQVKVRGQRVELGEIEHHVRECMPEVGRMAVEVIMPGDDKDKATVAVFVEQKEEEVSDGDGSSARVFFPSQVDSQLSERLPSYMVPGVYFSVAQLPMTTSGKTDRKRLREIGATFSAQQLAELRTRSQGPKRQPSTDKEKAMQQLWAQVLNIDADSIGLDDSFFRLGGDSITAMQVSSTARSLQISVTTADILEQKTISRLAHRMSRNHFSSNLVMEDPVNRHFSLTPIQELYLRLESTGSACFDQSFFLELSSLTNLESLRAAFKTLVRRHSMLRALFSQTAGEWSCAGSSPVRSGSAPTAVIAIHHLVIDLVSWRVLLEELEDLLLSRKLPAVPAVPFQAWQALQTEHATKHKCPSGVAQDEVASGESLSYWGIEPDAVKRGSVVSKQFALNEQTTSALLGPCNDVFQTRPVELMLAALAHSFAIAFSDRAPPTIFNESHGREPWDAGIDLSRTVGWFTSMLPIQVPSHTRGDLLEVIRHTKDGMRKFPDNGRSYFASRFADADTSDVFASMFPVEVIFNYQGVYQQLERTDSLFKTLPAPDGCEPASMLEAPRFALFDVSAVVEKGRMHVTVTSDSKAKRQQQVANWIERYEMALVEMATLLQKKHKQWTLSDLPLAFKTYEDLDSFQNDTLAELGVQPEEVEDVFPCLPMQEGILISQSRDPDAYRVSSIFEVIPTQQNQVNCTRLQQAWEAVVRRHSLLRALLVDNVPGSLGTTNVVLKDPQPSISFFRAAGDTATLAMFRAHQDTLAQQDSGLQHRMFICQLDNGKAYLCLDINHAIFDAHSRGVILRDLQSAYSANLNPDSGRFRDVVSYLTQQEQEETHAYWARYLDGVEPCFFSSMAEPQDVCYRDGTVHVPDIDANAVHTFCQTWDITIATIIQTAWALVLSRYTGATTPCFGNLSSRRDLPVEDVANIFGPLITTIACRVQLDEHKTVMDVLRAVQSDYTNSLPHQNISLASVHSMLGLGANALFNTILSLQRIDDTMAVNDSEIDFRGQSGSDPTEYAINIGAGYNRSVMEIEIHYQTRCIDDAQAANLAESLSQAIYGIITKTTSTIGDLQILSKRQQQQLWKWNGEVPPVVERCVHELFVEQARARPDAAAICAWDGEMKYGELDELSSRLAGYLVGLGVGPEAIVPLCFEKSMWTVVAMLAVLKAGGAFAPLDPEHPASRHEEIFRQTGARVVLASAQHSTLCSGGNRTVVVVSEAAMRELPSEASEASTTDKRTTTRTKAQPDNPAYVLFTSGSTGKPKGVVIEHRAILTSCLGHGKAYNLTSDSRFLQFSSYTFDVSITEIWTTLLMGGCTCVPSESDKKDDLLKAINALDANWAHLTPTVAKLLDPERIPGLQNLILGAELVTDHDWNRWSPYARQITTYGPTECCVLCTFYSGTLGFYTGLLGKSVASVSWVVDPNDHHKLAPLGAVGELLVEGPILARGYLNDAEKTAAAFIDDPAWLLEGCDQHAGRRGRLYKTGDLVYYNADGNLVYVNRKDAQVKVRGQRVELGEIEHHVRECMPEVGRMAVEVIMPGDDKDKATVAVFVEQKEEEVSDGDGSSARVFFPSQVDSQLSERLPSYMVPGVYFSVAQLPMTTSGKTDRKRLREIGATFSAQQLAELRTRSQGPKRQPSTDKEKAMQQLWAQVLNIDADSIGLDDSFFRLGGDSITAMQVSSTARSLQISVTTADILEQKTISRLAHRMSRNHFSSNLVMEDPVNRHFSLTPIQELYLRLESTGSACFDQSFFLELSSLTNLESLRAAFKTLVRRHSMLRALFSQTAGGRWQQHISDRGSASFTVDYVRCIDSKDVSEAIRQSRDGLDVQNGPVLAAVLCDQGQRQLLFIAIHHLVIDLVSWRVLLEELEDLLLSRKLPAVPAVPFQAWQALQTEHATKHKCPSGVAQDEVASGESLSYWGIEPDAVKRGSVVSKQFALNEQTTSALLGPCNDVFQTRPVELMLAALAHSFAIAFSDRAPPTIFNESHGREPWDAGIDLSRTVGWFTSMLPIQVPSHTRGDLLEVIRHTKDGMRKFPDNGRSYFASRFADADTSDVFASMFPVEVIFNYQGVYQQLERTDSLFKTLPAPDGCEPASMLEAPRFALFDVSAVVEKGRMHVTVTSDSKAKRQQQVANWIERYEMALVEMATLLQKKHKQWTLSDLPLAFKTYEDLDSFQNDTLAELGVQPEEVEDVFPCLPMQEGILISQSRDPDAYRVSSIFEVIPTQQNQVNCTRLQQAWEAVVRRHSLLRALLVDNVPGSLGTTNVVLKDPQPSISFFRAAGDTATLAMFRAHQDTLAQQDSGLQHRMFICQLDNGKAYLCLDINHAIFDAHSRGVILRDLQSAYSANLNPDSGRFRDVVSYLTQQEQEETHAYWARYLDGVEPCFFSSMAEPQDVCYRDGTVHVPDIDANAVHTFCQTWDITIATIIQTAWALVLSRYTGATTPCFGNLSSRRDLPVEDVANIFGPLITTIACRVQLDEHKTVMDVLRAVQSDYTNSLPHQNISLASVHSMLGLGANALFNTILSLQRIDDTMAVNDSEIDFRGQSGSDPTEYAINIGAGYNRSVMEIEIHYQTRCIDDAQAANLAESLSQAIYGIITKTTSTIGDLQILSKRQQQQLWKWNGEVPPVVERCVHELFVEQARARPDAAAICAWDGEMKYGELDELSSRLAGYLVGLGVGPEAIVPLCFEKSMWTVVAMLAVLKAGGAFAPLDPEHPASRHEEIFRQTGARVVLASAQHSTLCSGGNRTVVVVSEAAMRELPSEASEASTTDKRTTTRTKAQPDNPAYVLFTSGSTGKPKGVVIEHRAILTSCLGHGKAYNLTSDSRFLQFSSYTFDVSITEIWTTLLMGGCTCVPSESDKKDDLLKAINALDANWAHLTPTVAKLLDPERIPGLQNLILGAELVTDHDWNRWSPYARQITTYGPTECCVLCTFYSGTLGFYTGLLGKSVASVSWVVDPNDHHKLAPLGAVGELLVEGPILARGYLNDAEKTAAAFIDDPAWLLEGCDQHAGRRGRLYKTGDLVYYNADGNLVYVNRKDAQVKVRGQRVELGEIEHHVRECMPEVGRMAVEVIMPGDDKDKATVAVFVEQKEEEVSDGDGSSARVFFPSQVDSQLSERLPSYMVPGVYFSVAQLPMTTSGKTDRKRLREIGATFSAQQLAELRTRSQGPKRQPSTDKEKAMQQLWAQVLNIDADSIGLDDSFFRLGGDSITAMQVSSTARSLQISVTTADILEQKTISRLAHRMSRNHFSSNLVMEDPVNRHFSLTPIQELYLRLESTGSACFDQSFFLELSSLTNLESLRAAFKTLVRRHSMLRALFSQTAGGRWQQHISDRGSASFTVDYVRCIDSKDVSEAIRQSRDGLDVQNGPVLAAVLCDQGQRQLLFIAIHHLVIDLVSWRVLLEELEDLLLSRKLPAVPAVPFQAWQALQTEHATKHKCPSGVAQDEVASGESLSYWGIEPDAVKRGSVVSKQFALNEQTTSALLGPCNDVFQTRPVELMLAALAHSFAIAFSDRAPPTIFNESHGREPWDAGIDLSRTVGWFTSMLPIQVPSHTRGDLLEVIRHTKDGMRKFPDNGRSYFASRFADADTSDVFASMFPVEVIFNYQGVYQQLERTDSLFKTLPAPDGCEPASMLEAPRFALFDVSAVVEKGRMHVTVTSDSKAKRQQQVANWIERYEMALVEMATLLQKKHKQWTLSDLPLAFKTYEDLDSFQNDTLAELGVQPEEVEDVFPCLPMQEGILISQSRDPDAYRVSSIFEVIPTQQNQVNCTRLQQAWEAVVRRHSLLRALLVDNVPGSLGTTNVVLKDPQPSISFFRAAGDTATLAMFRAHQDTLAQQDSGLQHRMFICQLDNGKAYLCLDINHAIFDAHSRGVILRDLQSAYSANLNPDSGRFRDVVSYLTQQEQEETHAYWARYLDGVEPCFFSSMAEPQDVCYRDGTVHVPDIDANAVHTFCQTWDITIATIIQTAWALVLSRYTGATTPCFGNLSSRRDLPVEDVANIFGPLITTIACRVQLDEHKTVMDVLRAVQSDYTNSLPHQNISLASVHSMLGLGANALFNTILSLQRIDDTMAVNDSEIDFRGQSGSDPTEGLDTIAL